MKTNLNNLTLNRVDKLAARLRMITGLEVEVVASPNRVKFIVYPAKPFSFDGLVIADIVKYCSRYGLLFNIFAFHGGAVDSPEIRLMLEIYSL